MQHTTVDDISFTLITWQDLDELTRELGRQIRESGQEFDRIIAIANGGLTMARHLGDQIALRKISMMQTRFYAGIVETHREPRILQALTVDIAGENVLVFEDIVDTGATLDFIEPLLLDQYEAKSVTVAALVSKSWASVQPKFVAAKHDTWIIYPYETQESIRALQSKWQKANIDADEIVKRLLEIGFSSSDIQQFSQ